MVGFPGLGVNIVSSRIPYLPSVLVDFYAYVALWSSVFGRLAGVFTGVSPSISLLVCYPRSLMPPNHVQVWPVCFPRGPGLFLWWATGALMHVPGRVELRKSLPR